jgi:hypothetical protein
MCFSSECDVQACVLLTHLHFKQMSAYSWRYSILSDFSTAGCNKYPSIYTVRNHIITSDSMLKSGATIWQHVGHVTSVDVREKTEMKFCVAAEACESCYNRRCPVLSHPHPSTSGFKAGTFESASVGWQPLDPTRWSTMMSLFKVSTNTQLFTGRAQRIKAFYALKLQCSWTQ